MTPTMDVLLRLVLGFLVVGTIAYVKTRRAVRRDRARPFVRAVRAAVRTPEDWRRLKVE